MTRATGTVWWLLVGLALTHAVAQAGGKSWTLSGERGLAEGKLEGVSLLSSGEIVLASPLEKIEGLCASYVWDIVAAEGGVAYVATGSPAAIHTLRDAELELLCEAEEQHFLSVLPLPDGSVLAAAGPKAVLRWIDAEGKVTEVKALEEEYVWDMAPAPDGGIYCATGPNGRLVRLNQDREVEEVFKAKQKHLLCLAVEPKSGDVYAGTEPDGLIYRISREGEVSVLYDTEESEVHTLLVASDGTVYAGTAQSEQAPGAKAGPQGGAPAAGETTGASREAGALPGAPSAANSLYRIVPGEGAVRLARFAGAVVMSTAISPQGDVLVGTGVEGRIMGVNREGISRIVADLEPRYVTAMVREEAGSVLVGTSSGGGLWRLKRGLSSSGTYTSSVHDGGYLAGWGRVCWKGERPGGTDIAVRLRTGNVRKPDETWSAWSAHVRSPEGEAVEVPLGRFGQLQAVLSTEFAHGPRLIELCASYRQVNRRAHIKSFSIDDRGQDGKDGPPRGKKPSDAPPGQRVISWQATDPNEDELVFDLFYRAIDEKEWKELDTDIREKGKYEWDTRRVPDGHYVLRILASDRTERPSSEALVAEQLTAPFVIDNCPPHVEQLTEARRPDGSYAIMGLARDAYSSIRSIEVSRDSEEWEAVFPDDGIFDAAQERFTFHTPVLASGEHVFVFAVTDRLKNVGSGRLIVRVD